MVHYGQPPEELECYADYDCFYSDDRYYNGRNNWYDSVIKIFDLDPYKVFVREYADGEDWEYKEYQLPEELEKVLLDIRKEIVDSLKEDWKPGFFVKHAELRFIYKDQVYYIYPRTVGLWNYRYRDCYFGDRRHIIIDKLNKILGIEHTYYNDFLD